MSTVVRVANIADVQVDRYHRLVPDLMRFEAGIRERVVAMYRSLSKEIQQTLMFQRIRDPHNLQWQTDRYEALFKQTQEMLQGGTQKASELVLHESLQVGGVVAAQAAKAVNDFVKFPLLSVGVSPAVLEASVREGMFSGELFESIWKDGGASLQKAYKEAIQKAIISQDTMEQTGKRLEKLEGVAVQHAATYARTGVMRVLNTARAQVFKDNNAVTGGLRQVSTLDSRTTYKCIARDGLRWDWAFKPVGHDKAWEGGPGHLHYNCRSTSIAWFKDPKDWPDLRGPPRNVRNCSAAKGRH